MAEAAVMGYSPAHTPASERAINVTGTRPWWLKSTSIYDGPQLDGAWGVTSMPLLTLADWGKRAACINEYVEIVRALDFVEAVFEDRSDELTVLTVYRGNLDAVEDALYDAEAEVIHHCPDLPIDFHLISSERADIASLEKTARKVYDR